MSVGQYVPLIVTLAISILLLSACASPEVPSATNAAGFAIVGVDVVDVEAGVLRRDQTIIVQHDRIVAVSDARATRVLSGLQRVDGDGRTIIPGLWDMHTHVSSAGDCVLPTMVTYGVTGIRDMGASRGFEEVNAWRSAVRQDRLVGPDMRISTAPFESLKWLNWVERIEGRPWREGIGERIPLASPADAISAVQAARASGADLIKVRNIDDSEGDILRAMLTEAQRLGIRVAGHAPQGTPMNADAFNPAMQDSIGTAGRGFASIEHFDALYFGTMNDTQRTTVFERMREGGVMMTATTLAMRSRTADRAELQRLSAENATTLPDVSPRLRESWRRILAQPHQDFDWTGILNRADADARLAHGAGVTILAGSDMGVPGLIPGQVMHEELAIMVADLGMSPVDALRTATINAAKFWGEENEFGAITVGRRADFVLLDANPLDDIRATRRISAVMLRGDYFDADRLARLRTDTRQLMQAGRQCAEP